MTGSLQSKKLAGIALFCGFVMTFCTQSGCAKSPGELIIGRWYSGEMTIRFREDNAVIWNSPQGLALGRFDFSGSVHKLQSKDKVPNLLVDVIRNDERQQFHFDISFLGHDRLRMQLIRPGISSDEEQIGQSLVLRRANDNTLGGGTVQVASN